jgi:hypothetical protein
MPPTTFNEAAALEAETPIASPLVRHHIEISPLSLIAQAIEKGMSVADLKGLFDLQERYERNKAAQAFAEAITRFQRECPQIEKINSGAKDAYRYAPLEEVDRVARPYMVKHSIVPTFTTSTDEKGSMLVTCRIRVGTHTEETTIRLPPLQGNNLVNSAQVEAQRISYGKRYALCAALNIVTTAEDTDGLVGDNVNKAQQDEIMGLIRQCNEAGKPVDFTRFKEWLQIEKLEDLPQRELPKALTELRNKLKAAKGGPK